MTALSRADARRYELRLSSGGGSGPGGLQPLVVPAGELSLNLAPKFEGRGHVIEGLAGSARADNADGAEVEDPPRDSLLYGDPLDLPQHHLDRVALQHANLDHDAV